MTDEVCCIISEISKSSCRGEFLDLTTASTFTRKLMTTNSVLNFAKEYKPQPLMFGDEPGIFDSIHVNEAVMDLLRRAQAQIWAHDEFSFAPCKPEFIEENDGKDLMVDTLLYQWSADSLACNLYTLLQPFLTDDTMTQLILFNTFIECTHSATYSEIVKNAFPDPVATIESISTRDDVLSRLEKINETFSDLRQAGLDYSTGKRVLDADLLRDVYKGVVALYLMERLQFIASFAITFSLGEMGRFQPVCQAVRKICADETIIHAETDLLLLEDLKKNPLWEQVNTQEFKDEIFALMEEVINRELVWTDRLFKDRSLPGITAQSVKDWVMFNYQFVKRALGYPTDPKYKNNPLPFMNAWISSNNQQSAPQEQEIGQYLVGAISKDTGTLDIDLDF